jgi:uncharacterized protein (UPF0216 family)
MTLKSSGSLEKWISLETRAMNKNIVARQQPLSQLMEMESPFAETRGGDEHRFDRSSLENLASNLPDEIIEKLKIPIFFYFSVKVSDSCYLTDENAFLALKATNDLNPMYRFREGKLWISKPIAFEIHNKYPTLVQFVVH